MTELSEAIHEFGYAGSGNRCVRDDRNPIAENRSGSMAELYGHAGLQSAWPVGHRHCGVVNANP